MTFTRSMVTLKGVGNKRGCAVGKTEYIPCEEYPAPSPAGDPRRELNRLHNAIKKSREELCELYRSLSSDLGEGEAWVFLMQIYLLDGSLFLNTPPFYISEGKSANEALRLSCEQYLNEESHTSYIFLVSEDIRDVMLRVMSHLNDTAPRHHSTESFILLTPSPTPSQICELGDSLIGIVAKEGWEKTSAASLARALFIPSVSTNGSFDESDAHKNAIIDSQSGYVFIDPDLDTLENFTSNRKDESSFGKSLKARRLPLLAEPESLLDASKINETDLDGIGIFHSEELYLKSVSPPDEETLFEVYRSLAESLLPRPLVIRTFSVSGSVRINKITPEGIDDPEVYVFQDDTLKRQIRASLRAAVFGTVSLCVPCGYTYDSVKRTKELIASLSDELRTENREHREIPIGAIIDNLATAIMCDKILDTADFIILKTNALDLATNTGEMVLDAKRYLLERVARTAKRKKKPALLSLEKNCNTDTASLAKRLGFSALIISPDIVDRVD